MRYFSVWNSLQAQRYWRRQTLAVVAVVVAALDVGAA